MWTSCIKRELVGAIYIDYIDIDGEKVGLPQCLAQTDSTNRSYRKEKV